MLLGLHVDAGRAIREECGVDLRVARTSQSVPQPIGNEDCIWVGLHGPIVLPVPSIGLDSLPHLEEEMGIAGCSCRMRQHVVRQSNGVTLASPTRQVDFLVAYDELLVAAEYTSAVPVLLLQDVGLLAP